MTASVRTKNLLATALAAVLTGGGLAAAPAQASTAGAAAVSAARAAQSSTTLTVSPTTIEFGASVEATAQVTTTSGAPAGEVTFVVDGVSTKVSVVGGIAKLEVKPSDVGVQTVGATFTPSDPVNYQGSSAAPSSFTVVKADTTTRLRIIGKQLGEETSATVKVIGFHRTVPSGKVKLVLRRAGQSEILETRRGRLGKGSRGFDLGLLERGRYRAVVTYLGDANHRRSTVAKRFWVSR
ncbi:Ig-like domain-containing protein [Nocardioides sp.]|uniref:Ig-like domain-containing protein n=1 Tax=Nocardioides sp. TaxID=35761 RepID=UPI002C231E45|nr:Ig-like domain-containing protein [Nocardioides sp.]HXH78287.1 Ig-like domain-containing protein [Nocardioides sp.]